jgi:small subunit ribosomal protein S20
MPIKKSAIKALRQNVKRATHNAKWRSDVEALVRHVRKAITAGDAAKAKDWLQQAIRKIDRAAQKGVIKKNTASRRVSRLTRRVNVLIKK